MRCAYCRSYIPEGLPDPVTCPQCGKSASSTPQPMSEETPASAPSTEPQSTPAPEATTTPAPERDTTEPEVRWSPASELPTEPQLGVSHGFAPYFTVQTSLWFGPLGGSLSAPSLGSLSFGAEGFSVVWENGKQWQKILYRDLESPRLVGDSVQLTTREGEYLLVLYPSWFPKHSKGGRRKRALLFIELLERVKSGLSPFELSIYRRRLSA